MSRNYVGALVRVVILGILMTGLAVLLRPQAAMAAETCQQCQTACENNILSCLRTCSSEGLQGCNVICNPTGLTCREQCTDSGLCP